MLRLFDFAAVQRKSRGVARHYPLDDEGAGLRQRVVR
jgi:hypothetical protein